MNRQNNFKKNLIELRKSKQLSQEELASMLDISRQSVSKWESGESYPEMKILLAICEQFDLDLDELVYGEVSSHKKQSAKDIRDSVYDKSALYVGIALALFLLSFLAFAIPLQDGFSVMWALMRIVAFFIALAASLFLLAISYYKIRNYRINNEIKSDIYTAKEIEEGSNKAGSMIAGGIAGLAIDIAVMFALFALGLDCLVQILMIIILAASVFLIVYGAVKKSKYTIKKQK